MLTEFDMQSKPKPCVQSVNIFGYPLPKAFWKCAQYMHRGYELHLKECSANEADKRRCEAHKEMTTMPQLICWPGRNENCREQRQWAVFHDADEAVAPFDALKSVYIGTCTAHLPQALRYDPGAVNYVRPLTAAESEFVV